MSVSHLGDGSTPYADPFGNDASDMVLDAAGSAGEAEYLGESTHISLGEARTSESLEFEMVDELLDDLNAEIVADALTASQARTQTASLDPRTRLLAGESAVTQGVSIQANEFLINELPAAKLLAAEMPNVQGDLRGLSDLRTQTWIGGPFWGAEATWKRNAKNEPKSEKEGYDKIPQPSDDDQSQTDDEENDSSRTRKRQAAWRKYYETDLERRLKNTEKMSELDGR